MAVCAPRPRHARTCGSADARSRSRAVRCESMSPASEEARRGVLEAQESRFVANRGQRADAGAHTHRHRHVLTTYFTDVQNTRTPVHTSLAVTTCDRALASRCGGADADADADAAAAAATSCCCCCCRYHCRCCAAATADLTCRRPPPSPLPLSLLPPRVRMFEGQRWDKAGKLKVV